MSEDARIGVDIGRMARHVAQRAWGVGLGHSAAEPVTSSARFFTTVTTSPCNQRKHIGCFIFEVH